MPKQTKESIQSEIARLRKENAYIRGQNENLEKSMAEANLRLSVAPRGGVSLYGVGRFPFTLYQDQWDLVLSMAQEIRQFIIDNQSRLKPRPDRLNGKQRISSGADESTAI